MVRARDARALMRVFFRFFCGRYGAVAARIAILVWTFVGAGVGWVGYEIWSEFKATRVAVIEMKVNLTKYISGAEAKQVATQDRLDGLSAATGKLGDIVFNHEGRISRIEGRP